MRTTVALLAALLLAGCGPTEVEAGQAILWAAIPLTLIGLGLQALYGLAWRRLGAQVRLDWRVAGGLLVLLAAAALATIPFWDRGTDDWIGFAVLMVGTSYLSLLLPLLRLCVIRPLWRYYPWALALPWLLLWVPAAPMAFIGSTKHGAGDAAELLWLLPGMGGWTTAPLLLVAGVELAIRLVRDARRRREALPPPLPPARIHRS